MRIHHWYRCTHYWSGPTLLVTGRLLGWSSGPDYSLAREAKGAVRCGGWLAKDRSSMYLAVLQTMHLRRVVMHTYRHTAWLAPTTVVEGRAVVLI